jgi:hypothetical protein
MDAHSAVNFIFISTFTLLWLIFLIYKRIVDGQFEPGDFFLLGYCVLLAVFSVL